MTGIVKKPRMLWIRKNRILSGVLALALVVMLVPGSIWLKDTLFPPPLSCGRGMVPAAEQKACVGLNLDSEWFVPDESTAMRDLRAKIKRVNDQVSGDYVSIVLLLNMTPASDVDTFNDDNIIPQIEGAITAVWRANYTNSFGGLPKVKLLLANMGRQYQHWRDAVDQIKANAAANQITSVFGVGQSNKETRQAVAALSGGAPPQLPVIDATATADSMSIDPNNNQPLGNFFQVTPTNSQLVDGAVQYIDSIQPAPSRVLVVQDTAARDDYTATLREAAKSKLERGGRVLSFQDYTSPETVKFGNQREEYLRQQFHLMRANLCQQQPSVVFYAGRGTDLSTFAQTWAQGIPCQTTSLPIITGDDAAVSIKNPAVNQAIAARKVTIVYTALAAPDQWDESRCSPGTPADAGASDAPNGAKENYGTFLTAFTSSSNTCARVGPGPSPVRLDFPAEHLDNGQAMLVHDAAMVSIEAARKTRYPDPVEEPHAQKGTLQQFRCSGMLPGASGWVGFNSNQPINKPIPMVEIQPGGKIKTKQLVWSDRVELNNLPETGELIPPVC